MAVGGLLALLDDVAALMDKVAIMAKANTRAIGDVAGTVANKAGATLTKASGVVGDDIAVGSEKLRVSQLEEKIGLQAKRELAIVGKVAKGSSINKVWITAGGVALSATAPWALKGLLVIGGLFLCKEGAEKVAHEVSKRLDGKSSESNDESEGKSEEAPLDAFQLEQLEDEKVKSAIRTDVVLSGEIILLGLGLVADEPMLTQVATMAAVGVAMTVGVYGSVAALVKLDDAGMFLKRWGEINESPRVQNAGKKLMVAMPALMKTLSVVGVAAMLSVGGGILLHALPKEVTVGVEGLGSAVESLAGLGLGLCAGLGVVGVGKTSTGQWFGKKMAAFSAGCGTAMRHLKSRVRTAWGRDVNGSKK